MSVSGNLDIHVRLAAGGFSSGTRQITGDARQAQSATDALDRSFSRLRATLASVGLGLVIRDIMQAVAQFHSLERTLQAVTGQGAQQLAFLRAEAKRLGLDLGTAGHAYAQFIAAASAAHMPLQTSRRLFSAVSGAMTVMGASSEQTGRALMALNQMISKGKISQEEMRQQLGEALPGALQHFAAALGVTVPKLNQMIEKGLVLGKKEAEAFSAQLEKVFGPAVLQAAEGITARLNRVKTAIFELKVAAGEGMMEGLLRGFSDVERVLTGDEMVARARELGRLLGTALRLAGEGAAYLVDNLNAVRNVIAAILLLRFARWWQEVLTQAAASIAGLKATTGASVQAAQAQAAYNATLERGAGIAGVYNMTVLRGTASAAAATATHQRQIIAVVNMANAQDAASVATHANTQAVVRSQGALAAWIALMMRAAVASGLFTSGLLSGGSGLMVYGGSAARAIPVVAALTNHVHLLTGAIAQQGAVMARLGTGAVGGGMLGPAPPPRLLTAGLAGGETAAKQAAVAFEGLTRAQQLNTRATAWLTQGWKDLRGVLGMPPAVAVGIAVVALALQTYIDKVREAHAAEMQRLSDYQHAAQGAATLRDKVREITEAKSKEEAQTRLLREEEAKLMATRLASAYAMRDQAQRDLTRAQKDTAAPWYKPWVKGAGQTAAAEARRELDMAEANVESMLKWIDRYAEAMQKWGLTTHSAAAETNKATDEMSKKQKQLADQIAETIRQMRSQAAEAKALTTATGQGTEALRAHEVASARLAATLKGVDFLKDAAEIGLKVDPNLPRILADYAEEAVRAGHATQDMQQALDSARASLTTMAEASGTLHEAMRTGGMETKDFAGATADLLGELAKARLTLSQLIPGTSAYLALEKQIAESTKDVGLATSETMRRQQAWKKTLDEIAERSLAKLHAQLERIYRDTQILQGGDLSNLFAGFEDELRVGLQFHLEPFADETMEEYSARWRASAAAMTAALYENHRAQVLNAAGLVTLRTAYLADVADRREAVRLGLLTAEEGETAIWHLRSTMISQQLNHWTEALGFLSQMFGGFFSYLHSLAQGLQQAESFGQSVKGIAGGMTNNAALAAGIGAAATTFAVFAVAYDIVDKAIKDSKTRRYGTQVDLNLVGGDFGTSYMSEKGQEVVKAIKATIRGIEDALGISITDLREIGIKVRNDGKRVMAYVGEQLIGIFGSVQEAIQEALRVALTQPGAGISGLSDLMRQGLSEWTAPDFEGMMEFLQQLREISDLSLSEGIGEIRDVIQNLDRLRDTLSKLREVTPGVLQGFQDLAAAEINAWQSLRDAITGRKKTAAEELRIKQQEARLFNAELALRQANVRAAILELKAKIELYRATHSLVGGGGGSGGRGGNQSGTGSGGLIGVARAFAVVAGAADVAAAAIAGTGDAYLDAMYAQLHALELLEAALREVQPIDPGSVRVDGGGGGDSRRRRQEERQAIRDDLRGLSFQGIGSQILDAQERFADLADRIRDAGFSAEEMGRLLAEAGERLRRELQRIKQDLMNRRQDFINRGTAAGGPLSTALRDISREEQQLIADTRELERAGQITRQELHRLNREIREVAAAQREAAATAYAQDLLLELYQLLGMEEEAAKLRYNMALAELMLRRAELDMAIRLYGLVGLQPLLDEIDVLIGKVKDAGPGLFGPGGGPGVPDDGRRFRGYDDEDTRAAREEAERLAKLVEDAEKMLLDYERQALSQFTRDVLKLDEDFEKIRAALGDTTRVQQAYAVALREIIDRHLEPLRQFRAGIPLSQYSTLEPGPRLMTSFDQFNDLVRQIESGEVLLPDVADRLIQQSQSLLDEALRALPGGSGGYQAFVNLVTGTIDRLLATFGGGIDLNAGPELDLAIDWDGSPGSTDSTPMHVEWSPVVTAIHQATSGTVTALSDVEQATERVGEEVATLRTDLLGHLHGGLRAGSFAA